MTEEIVQNVPVQDAVKKPAGKMQERRERAAKFVVNIAKRLKAPGVAAALRRADMPDRRFDALRVLAGYGIKINGDSWETAAYAAAAAGLARTKAGADGTLNMGEAIRKRCNNEDTPVGESRLRRLIYCSDPREFLHVMHAVATWLESGDCRLCWAETITDICSLGYRSGRQWVEEKWINGLCGSYGDA